MPYAYGLEYTLLTCATCDRDVNADVEDMTRLDDDWQCKDCLQMCPGCMEHITDVTIKTHGVIVHWRDYVLDGQKVTMHCDCAASTFLKYLMPDFDDDYTTRGEIAAAIEPHYAAALVLAVYPDAVCIERNRWFYIFKRMAVAPHFTASNIVDFGRSEREAWINAGKEVRSVPSFA